ncbi:MAG: FecR family protein [Pikeienuella sp.]
MTTRKLQALCFGATAFAVTCASAIAQERAGITVRVQQDAFQAVGALGTALSERDEIYRDARVYTKQYGSMDIKLEDGTDLVVQENSSLVIDKYVYAGPGKAGSLAISLSRGAMRMVSGKMSKPSYTINTPVATIGVRGTTFTLAVTEEETGVWVEDGTVVANAGGQNFEINAPGYASCGGGGCTVGEAPPTPAGYPIGGGAGESQGEVDDNEGSSSNF